MIHTTAMHAPRHAALVALALLVADAAAQDSVARASSARQLADRLSAWIAQRSSDSQYEDAFVPYRNALLRAKCSGRSRWVGGGGTVPPLYPLLEPLQALDGAMKEFPGNRTGSVDREAADRLLQVVRAFREKGQDSVDLLLPWLLMLEQNAPDDPGIAYCVFEAWASLPVASRTVNDVKDAEARLQAVLERAANDPNAARLLQRVSFEVEALQRIGKEPVAALRRLTAELSAASAGAKAMLPARALSRAVLAELDVEYETAVRNGDRDRVVASLEAMLRADPDDPSPELFLVLADPARLAAKLEAAYGTESRRPAIEARLQRLGFARVAPGTTVDVVVRELARGNRDDGPLAPAAAFFVGGIESEIVRLGTEVARLEKSIREDEEFLLNVREQSPLVAQVRERLQANRELRDRAVRRSTQRKENLTGLSARRAAFRLGG